MDYTKKLNFKLSDELYDYSKIRASELGQSVASYIRGLILKDKKSK